MMIRKEYDQDSIVTAVVLVLLRENWMKEEERKKDSIVNTDSDESVNLYYSGSISAANYFF
jgi:hypothetical protein